MHGKIHGKCHLLNMVQSFDEKGIKDAVHRAIGIVGFKPTESLLCMHVRTD